MLFVRNLLLWLEFAEKVINDGLSIVAYTILPHADNPEFAEAVKMVASMPHENNNLIKLKDSQAVIFEHKFSG